MVKFLTSRPVAVSMTFIALIILGIVAMTRLPVSLMPDISVPEITVQIEGKNMPVRQMENGVVRTLRRQLLQVPHLKSIRSESRDENATIRLEFEYGTNIDLAFIDVNEKIDRSMNYLPDDVPRPRVIKASASDIPVFYMNVTAKESFLNAQQADKKGVTERFVELSRFTNRVIKKRLEQLPEVAMADISGTVKTEIAIIPDEQKLRSLNLHFSDIEQAIRANNLDLGNIVVKDGIYQYNLRFEQSLNNKHNIENILLKAGDKNLRLDDIATIKVRPAKRSGLVTSQGENAISLAIIKKSGARMQDMQESLHKLTRHFRSDYKDLHFEIMRDQTKLLDYSIHNLGNTLLLGAILAFLIMFLFLRDIRSPLLIGISIPTSLIISILFFYVFDISINIISLSGLVLGIGMMIDNSIIVIDNITQYIDRGNSLVNACIKGTNEVIRPLLSSVLTTCAVFIPLIFISGLAGALFYDQAVAVAIGLFTSFFVSITLIPVYYKLVYKKESKGKEKTLKPLKVWDYYASYERGLKFVLRKQGVMMALFLLLIGCAVVLYQHLQKERIPQIKHDELFVSVEWNEKINVQENKERCLSLLNQIDTMIHQSSVYAGTQQYLMNLDNPTSPRASKIYLKLKEGRTTKDIKQQISTYFREHHPNVKYEFQPPENVFELLFSDEQPPLVAHIMPFEKEEGLVYSEVKQLVSKVRKKTDMRKFSGIPSEEHIEIALDPERLKTYEIARKQVVRKLKTLFSEYQVTEIKSTQHFMPIMLAHTEASLMELINRARVKNRNGSFIPLKEVLELKKSRDFKQIIAGKAGEYFPLPFSAEADEVNSIQKEVKQIASTEKGFNLSWHGSLFASKRMVKEILVILLISLLLLYFILASQFESLSLPLIVLLEVPIDITGAFFFLWLFGETINIMSLIGVIVMAGIIINDSILKIDTINRLRKEGMPLIKALIVGGQRRLKPILMTSLTTIMAMTPFLFISGMGADLQRPLAVSVIGGMAVGTFVSLYFIPLFFYLLKRKETKKYATAK
jgi:multidrug efflux pump subunit AcrB